MTLKKWMTPIALMVAAALPLVAQSTPGHEAFDITLPTGFAEFTKQVQKAESPEGTVETTNWISRAESGEAVVVTVSKMPGHILDPDKLIDATRDSLLKSLKATLENEEDVTGELPETRLQFRSDAAVLQSKLLVDDDRLYQVLYVGRSPEQRAAPAVAQLFSSFRIAAETGTTQP
jgi:hypothetical protein